MSDAGGGPPAGWYDDPEVPGGKRYWDGEAWGEQRPPEQPPWVAPPDAGAGWSSSAGTGGGAPMGGARMAAGAGGATVNTWLWQSIAATVLCCLPLGIVAIVKSAQAGSARDGGNLALAQRRAAEARTWTLWSVGVGVIGGTLWLLFVVGMSAMSGF